MEQELYQLIVEAKKGHKESFAKLVRRFQGDVYRHALGMLGDRMDAEDVVQEAFVKAFYSLSKLESEYAFSSWLTRIVSHLCYDRIQRKKRETAILRETAAVSSIPAKTDDRELQLAIQEAMQKLTTEHREIIVLRDVQGYPYSEIAAILHIPLGTVKSRINTARLLLRQELETKE